MLVFHRYLRKPVALALTPIFIWVTLTLPAVGAPGTDGDGTLTPTANQTSFDFSRVNIRAAANPEVSGRIINFRGGYVLATGEFLQQLFGGNELTVQQTEKDRWHVQTQSRTFMLGVKGANRIKAADAEGSLLGVINAPGLADVLNRLAPLGQPAATHVAEESAIVSDVVIVIVIIIALIFLTAAGGQEAVCALCKSQADVVCGSFNCCGNECKKNDFLGCTYAGCNTSRPECQQQLPGPMTP